MAETQQSEMMPDQESSSMIDQIMDTIPQDMAAEEPPSSLDEALDSQTEEATPNMIPDEGMMMQLFEIVYGGKYDPASPMDQERIQKIESMLQEDPELAGKINSGELSMTEFAIKLYRDSPDNLATIT